MKGLFVPSEQIEEYTEIGSASGIRTVSDDACRILAWLKRNEFASRDHITRAFPDIPEWRVRRALRRLVTIKMASNYRRNGYASFAAEDCHPTDNDYPADRIALHDWIVAKGRKLNVVEAA